MADNFPRAIFLDLDDTIIDDSSSVDGGWRTAIVEQGLCRDTPKNSK